MNNNPICFVLVSYAIEKCHWLVPGTKSGFIGLENQNKIPGTKVKIQQNFVNEAGIKT